MEVFLPVRYGGIFTCLVWRYFYLLIGMEVFYFYLAGMGVLLPFRYGGIFTRLVWRYFYLLSMEVFLLVRYGGILTC
jgi:hypothetical protein